jgi:hypothetical protein
LKNKKIGKKGKRKKLRTTQFMQQVGNHDDGEDDERESERESDRRDVVTTYNQSRDHGEQRLGSYLDT